MAAKGAIKAAGAGSRRLGDKRGGQFHVQMGCHEMFGPAKDVRTGISARQGQTGTSCVQGGADHGNQRLLHRGLDTKISLPFCLLHL